MTCIVLIPFLRRGFKIGKLILWGSKRSAMDSTASATTSSDAAAPAEPAVEGAGFLLHYKNRAVFGRRIPKRDEPDYEEKLGQLEYPCGKAKPGETCAFDIARSSLIEKVGGDLLENTWKERAIRCDYPLPNGKLFVLFILKMTDHEVRRLKRLDVNLGVWPEDKEKSFDQYTGREAPARKALSELVWVRFDFLGEVVECFQFATTKGDLRDLAAENPQKAAEEFLENVSARAMKLTYHHNAIVGTLRPLQLLVLHKFAGKLPKAAA